MFSSRHTTILALWIALWGLPAFAADVLVPKDKVIVNAETVFVVGSSRPGAELSVQIENGGDVREGATKARQDGTFHFSIPLSPGINRLSVGGEVREVYVPTGKERALSGFAPQRLHAGSISQCGDCHDVTMGLREGGYPGACLACHVIEAQNPDRKGALADDRHFRASGSKCGKCHDPHGAADAKLLLGTSETLCGACHGVQEFSEETHAAYEEGGCVACHDPHFSGYPNQLVQTVPGLCQECHEEGSEEDASKLHAPVVEGRSCATCHDPHGAGGDLLRADVTEQCASCHGEVLTQGHSEELAECATCHDPHAAMGSGLARGEFEESCAECHDGISDFDHVHPALEEGCEACHNPHSKHGGMLRADQQDVCGECHEIPEPGEGKAVHAAVETCTDCHGPHGGTNAKYLPSKIPSLCLDCHDDPREAGAKIHPALDEGCLACHDPHTGYALGVLSQPETKLCAECHDGLASEGPHVPEVAGEGCSCCHNPHASDTDHFLREEAATLLETRKPCVSGQP